MEIKTDLEIAQAADMKDIREIAASIGIDEKYLELYGNYKAKLVPELAKSKKDQPNGKLILVTATSPTPAGEGKTTTSIGLADALHRIGKKTMAALREPSMGPVFGIKGGAAGGGYAQVIPMEDINLHFTGDMHAIGAANNLIAACLDNSIIKGNKLNIDPRRVIWKRCVDMNDRQLRYLVDGLGGPVNGTPREDGFEITVASQIMAILCLAKDITDLKARIGRALVAYTYDDQPVTVSDLKVEGAATAILKDALKPNLVQTLEGTPVLIHGGPFANIAHGCNSVIATKTALKLADYVVTEAGFAADLGAEKFMDIKCRQTGLQPDACVLVTTVRSMKYQGGVAKDDLNNENVEAVKKGLPNLLRHLDNMQNNFNLPVLVAINKFPFDTEAEIAVIREECAKRGANVVLSDVWAHGGAGGEEMAKAIVELVEQKHETSYTYDLDLSIKEKIEAVAKKIYRADGVDYTSKAEKDIAKLEKLGFGNLAVCMAKTQYSFTDDPKKLCAPEGFRVTVTEAYVSAGAGFVVVKTGNIMTM
ncbi:MAG: formate--tetrahydrofolate ligase, partial [Eubacteriales bacterium]|nr:formate--tetrahydrofolate ligase [Eubacteriales bacterium]